MTEIVINTSPFIFLAKLNKLHFLDKYKIAVPEAVLKELQKKDSPEIFAINLFLTKNKKNIKITKNIKEIIKIPNSLHKGEKQVILYAISKKINTVGIDDKKARIYARILGLKTIGTLGIILENYKKKRINKKETLSIIWKLPKIGFRIKEEVFVTLIEQVNK